MSVKYQNIDLGGTTSNKNGSTVELSEEPRWSPASNKKGDSSSSIRSRSVTTVHKQPWFPPFLIMSGMWLLGAAAALGHHFYNVSRDGRVPNNQSFTLRVGIAFAFLVKSLLSISVSLGIIQLVWQTISGKDFSFQALDHLFYMSFSAAGLLSREVLLKAKLVSFAGLCFMLLPLSSITPPSSLTVVTQSYKDPNARLCRVPTLNFHDNDTQSTTNTFLIDSNTVRGNTNLAQLGGPAQFSIMYNGPTSDANRMATAVGYAGQIANLPSYCGVNCSYSLSFYAPSLKCDKVDWETKEAPWYNEEKPLYVNRTQFQASSQNGSIWVTWAYFKKDKRQYDKPTGLPWRQPVLGGILQYYNETFELKAVRCNSYNTSYQVTMLSNASEPVSVKYVNITRLETYNTSLITQRFSDRTEFPAAHGAIEAFALQDAVFNSLLKGSLWESGGAASTQPGGDSPIVNTNLVERWLYPPTSSGGGQNFTVYFPMEDLGPGIEQIHRNVTMSLLSRRDLFVYEPNSQSRCNYFGSRNIYKYTPRSLFLSYGLGLGVSLIVVIMGCVAIIRNGEGRDVTFTSVVTATRDDRLNSLVKERTDGGSNSSKNGLNNYRLRYLGGIDGFRVSTGLWDGPTEYVR